MFVASNRAPAVIGQSLESVETPAAIVDVESLRRNISAAVSSIRKLSPGVTIRPHSKSHKCAEIAALQIALSDGLTTGVCCQKTVEAEALVSAGIPDVLVTNQIVDEDKASRLASLSAKGARVGVLVDSLSGAALLSRVAASLGTTLDVLVEIDVGQNRCGVPTAAEAVILGKAILEMPGLRFRGIQAYHGAAQHVRSAEERRSIVARTAAKASEVRDALIAHGVPCEVVTGGGTGTFLDDAVSGVFTELQPGSYIFNDADYARNHGPDGREVMSLRAGDASSGWAVLDSGLKAQSTDSGPGTIVCTAAEFTTSGCSEWDAHTGRFCSSVGHLDVLSVSDEHSKIAASPSLPSDKVPPLPPLGTKVLLIPGHCDPFINHYDWIVGVEGGKVSGVWRLGSRSPGL